MVAPHPQPATDEFAGCGRSEQMLTIYDRETNR
jgi:hypothetical protein